MFIPPYWTILTSWTACSTQIGARTSSSISTINFRIKMVTRSRSTAKSIVVSKR